MTQPIITKTTIAILFVLMVSTAAAADLSGTWEVIGISLGKGEYVRTLVITQDGETLIAKMGNEELSGSFKNGEFELSGRHKAPERGYTAALKFTGKLEGEKLVGDIEWDTYTLTFTATRAE